VEPLLDGGRTWKRTFFYYPGIPRTERDYILPPYVLKIISIPEWVLCVDVKTRKVLPCANCPRYICCIAHDGVGRFKEGVVAVVAPLFFYSVCGL
jgi:hypothetical protein